MPYLSDAANKGCSKYRGRGQLFHNDDENQFRKPQNVLNCLDMTKRRITQRLEKEKRASIVTEGSNEGGEMDRNYPVAAKLGRLPARKNKTRSAKAARKK
jgi:hypothetical protein